MTCVESPQRTLDDGARSPREPYRLRSQVRPLFRRNRRSRAPVPCGRDPIRRTIMMWGTTPRGGQMARRERRRFRTSARLRWPPWRPRPGTNSHSTTGGSPRAGVGAPGRPSALCPGQGSMLTDLSWSALLSSYRQVWPQRAPLRRRTRRPDPSPGTPRHPPMRSDSYSKRPAAASGGTRRHGLDRSRKAASKGIITQTGKAHSA
jgi:hypothetical protein